MANRKTSSRPWSVLVALDRTHTARIAGTFCAAKEFGPAVVQLLEPEATLTSRYIDTALANGTDAFIVGIAHANDALRHIRERHVPLAVISEMTPPSSLTIQVQTDDKAIAEHAVRTLTHHERFKSFAYYPAKAEPEWSRQRESCFRRLVAAHNRSFCEIPENGAADILKRQRLPLAVFAGNDTYALHMLSVCSSTGLKVPDDVSIVGVDNDVLLCENASVPITSIEPDFENEGYQAMRALLALLNTGHRRKSIIRSGVLRTAYRETLPAPDSSTGLVNRALQLIREKALMGIKVSDICATLRVSRQLLDLRFHEAGIGTAKGTLLSIRLAAVQERLAKSDDSISTIGRQCGFASENNLKKLFRKRLGISMSEWRSRQKTTFNDP